MKTLCKILTLGFHWWAYGRHPVNYRHNVHCRICGHVPGNQWEIYRTKILPKKERWNLVHWIETKRKIEKGE